MAQQLGNVASELSRAKHWEEKHDLNNREQAFIRALELIDLTLGDRRWRVQLKEIARLREVVGDWFLGSNIYAVQPAALIDYCSDLTLYSQRQRE